MKITLVQSEIETAIEDYLRQQITINDDMEVTIDLSATRGPEGFKADIDIQKKAAPVAADTLNIGGVVRKTRQTKTQAEPVGEIEITDKTAVETARAVVEGDAVVVDAKDVTETVKSTDQAEEPVADALAIDQPEVVTEVPPSKPSLFGGLKKPVNTKPAE